MKNLFPICYLFLLFGISACSSAIPENDSTAPKVSLMIRQPLGSLIMDESKKYCSSLTGGRIPRDLNTCKEKFYEFEADVRDDEGCQFLRLSVPKMAFSLTDMRTTPVGLTITTFETVSSPPQCGASFKDNQLVYEIHIDKKHPIKNIKVKGIIRIEEGLVDDYIGNCMYVEGLNFGSNSESLAPSRMKCSNIVINAFIHAKECNEVDNNRLVDIHIDPPDSRVVVCE